MSRAGRKPLGPALVEHLEGSEQAKQRLEVILQTITGELTIEAACQRLGICPARLHVLRTEVLEAGLARLEPRPVGRPPQILSPAERRIAELEAELREKQRQQKALETQLEIAQVAPQLVGGGTLKKTAGRKPPAKRPRRRGK
jgi:transposase-like protein